MATDRIKIYSLDREGSGEKPFHMCEHIYEAIKKSGLNRFDDFFDDDLGSRWVGNSGGLVCFDCVEITLATFYDRKYIGKANELFEIIKLKEPVLH